jgi:hypothetical protein
MKAFISVSVLDELERALFGHKLNGKNFDIGVNDNWGKELDILIKRKIERSHLFVGFMTTNKNKESVLNEWHHAQSKGIPNLLLLEDTVRISEPLLGNVIVFNRKKPQKAIGFIQEHMKMTLPSTTLNREDVIAWTLGGEALIDILEWFERNEKQEKLEKSAVMA